MNRQRHNDTAAGSIVGGFAALVIGVALATGVAIGQTQGAPVDDTAQRQYCQDVALWIAEEARNVPINLRVGQPDYRGTAAEQCPAIRHSHLLHLAQRQRQPVQF